MCLIYFFRNKMVRRQATDQTSGYLAKLRLLLMHCSNHQTFLPSFLLKRNTKKTNIFPTIQQLQSQPGFPIYFFFSFIALFIRFYFFSRLYSITTAPIEHKIENILTLASQIKYIMFSDLHNLYRFF